MPIYTVTYQSSQPGTAPDFVALRAAEEAFWGAAGWAAGGVRADRVGQWKESGLCWGRQMWRGTKVKAEGGGWLLHSVKENQNMRDKPRRLLQRTGAATPYRSFKKQTDRMKVQGRPRRLRRNKVNGRPRRLRRRKKSDSTLRLTRRHQPLRASIFWKSAFHRGPTTVA